GFCNLAEILRADILANRNVHFIFVPGPDDPSFNSILPRSELKFLFQFAFFSRPPLPYSLFELMKNVPNCSFASNPCRIQYASQEIVVFRQDLVEKMCRNSIHMPSSTADISEHVSLSIFYVLFAYFFIYQDSQYNPGLVRSLVLTIL
ncbi:unnamed protein product, partial [Gongylonema pulchrum]|uniref:DNA polymerase II subunit 2 n=1 Tax=Gongylonema pulchrum TaxID=637853 RepID=A0A183E3Z5_9BILA